MDLTEIKQLIDLMERSDLTELEIEQEGLKLRICRGPSGQITATTSSAPAAAGQQAAQPPPPAEGSAAAADSPAAPIKEENGYAYIKSPMVGTFYRAAAPEMPPFVEPSQDVDETTAVCIIEAMKVMNEIQAEVKGTIVEVLVENGQPVEYGEPLFKVKTSQA